MTGPCVFMDFSGGQSLAILNKAHAQCFSQAKQKKTNKKTCIIFVNHKDNLLGF